MDSRTWLLGKRNRRSGSSSWIWSKMPSTSSSIQSSLERSLVRSWGTIQVRRLLAPGPKKLHREQAELVAYGTVGLNWPGRCMQTMYYHRTDNFELGRLPHRTCQPRSRGDSANSGGSRPKLYQAHVALPVATRGLQKRAVKLDSRIDACMPLGMAMTGAWHGVGLSADPDQNQEPGPAGPRGGKIGYGGSSPGYGDGVGSGAGGGSSSSP